MMGNTANSTRGAATTSSWPPPSSASAMLTPPSRATAGRRFERPRCETPPHPSRKPLASCPLRCMPAGGGPRGHTSGGRSRPGAAQQPLLRGAGTSYSAACSSAGLRSQPLLWPFQRAGEARFPSSAAPAYGTGAPAAPLAARRRSCQPRPSAQLRAAQQLYHPRPVLPRTAWMPGVAGFPGIACRKKRARGRIQKAGPPCRQPQQAQHATAPPPPTAAGLPRRRMTALARGC